MNVMAVENNGSEKEQAKVIYMVKKCSLVAPILFFKPNIPFILE